MNYHYRNMINICMFLVFNRRCCYTLVCSYQHTFISSKIAESVIEAVDYINSYGLMLRSERGRLISAEACYRL